ncbi:MAG: [Fe-Fe] hydrogenase large subunit C-terminal domain-containing protein, partial [Clostridia bacterium]
IMFVEFYYPDLIPNLSTFKSPHQMFGALVKTYYAQKTGLDPENIYTVAIMPCTAKKFEKVRDGEDEDGQRDIDAVLTTRELARLLMRNGIQLLDLEDDKPDNPMSEYSGAGAIFGASGGVMEAALRTAVEVLDGKNLDAIDFTQVRGAEGIKEASYWAGGRQLKVAVANGITNAKKICDDVRAGKCDYQFIEVMTCPGGCVNGGGQPIKATFVKHKDEVKQLRAQSLYEEDRNMPIRKSHLNESVQQVYKEYLGQPGGECAHEILHTRFIARKKY